MNYMKMESSVGVAVAAIIISSSSLIIIMMILLAWRVLEWVWFGPKRLERRLRNQGFHGNPYKPINGDLKEILAMKTKAHSAPISFSDDDQDAVVFRVDSFLHHTVSRHGKKSFMWYGPVPHVIIMEPELIKQIMSKNFIFQKANQHPIINLVATGTASYNLDKWTKHRKIVNPAFHMEKLKNMLAAFYESCIEMTSAWEKIVKESEEEIDVWPQFKTLSAEVISRTAFGSSYKEGRKIFQLQREQIELFVQALAFIHIPGYRFLPTKLNRRMKQIAKEVDSLLMDLIDKRLEAIKDGKDNHNDLLAVLLESNFKEIEQEKENGDKSLKGMSIQDVIEESKLFYLAGQETTAILLVWTMVLLSKHQDWQIRARNEILEAFGNNGTPDFYGLNHLKIVTAILYEVLRLYPPLVSVTRIIHEDTELGSSTVLPKGVKISIPTYLLHYDKEIWGNDAKEFNPERFSGGVSKATKSQVSYFPFGWGPRTCIGQNFALLEAKMALVLILQRFSFELSPSYAHAPFPAVLVQPQFGAHLILRKL